MKKMKKLFLLSLIAMVAVGCGKNSSSSGDGRGHDDFNNFSKNSGSTVSLNSVKEKFSKLNTSSNSIRVNDVVYHIGPAYAPAQGSNFNFKITGCINLIFKQYGDCGSGSGFQSYWNSIIDQGSWKVVTSVSSSSVKYKKLVKATSTQLDYEYYDDEQKAYSKNSVDYRDMLALDADNYFGTNPIASVAMVTLEGGQNIEAYLIERFDGYANFKFVVSPKLPLIANPVAILDGYGNFIGALKGVGNRKVRAIQVNTHYQYGQQITPGGYKQIQL